MITSHGNAFRITGPYWMKSVVDWGILIAEVICWALNVCVSLYKLFNKQCGLAMIIVLLWRHRVWLLTAISRTQSFLKSPLVSPSMTFCMSLPYTATDKKGSTCKWLISTRLIYLRLQRKYHFTLEAIDSEQKNNALSFWWFFCDWLHWKFSF